MEQQKVVFVSHCVMNSAAKLQKETSPDPSSPRKQLRRKILQYILDNDIQVIQLPCPEFTMYGPLRWGHVKEQFDNPFFIEHSRRILEPVVLQMKAYLHPEVRHRFRVLGIIGVDGSPSCGVHFTCSAPWGGELSSNENLPDLIRSIKRKDEQGVFIRLLKEMMEQHNIDLPMVAINENDQDSVWKMLEAIN